MSNRIRKHKKKSFKIAALRRCSLLRAFSLSYSLIILSYYNCIIQGISSYHVSEADSSYYEAYVLANRIDCDILRMTEKQLMNFTAQHTYLEDEIQRTTKKLL